VVAGWADEREAAALDGLDGAAGSEERGLPARLRGDGVRVEQRRRLERGQPAEVGGLVAAL
jgi:hypothetical protein